MMGGDTYGVIIAYKNMDRCHQALTSAMANHGMTEDCDLEIWIPDNTELNENIHRVWNRELEKAAELGTPFFLILNPDTKCEPGWLGTMIEIMAQNPRVVAVGPSTNHCYNEQANRDPKLMKLAKGSWVPNVLVPGFCAVFRTQALIRVGGFREDFRFYGGDLDLVKRLQLAGWLSAWAVDAFVWHEWGGSARALGDSQYQELRYTGNVELQKALNLYQEKEGLWIAEKGGGVRYVPPESGSIASEGQEDARGEHGEREAVVEEAEGVLRSDRLGEATP